MAVLRLLPGGKLEQVPAPGGRHPQVPLGETEDCLNGIFTRVAVRPETEGSGDCCSGLEVTDTLALTLGDWSVQGKCTTGTYICLQVGRWWRV